MKSNLTHKMLLFSAVLLLMGGGIAFAHGWGNDGYGSHMMGYGPGHGGRGMGYGMMGQGGYGMGPGMGGYGCPGYGRGQGYGNLTTEQREQLNAAQQKFFADTQNLREQIQNKGFTLHEELAKPTPDEGKLSQLQKELSKLESDFDQKAVKHQVEIRKILPNQQ